MIKLFYVPNTRSTRPRWMLEELGVPYELVRMTAAQTKTPEYLKVHPLGKVPALQDEGVTVIESAAIIAYLADRFPDQGLAPPAGQRGAYYQWIIFAMATLEPALAAVVYHTRLRPEEKRVPLIAAEGRASFDAAARAIALDGEYLLGRFSAADIVLGSVVLWGASAKLLEDLPELKAYADRLRARPAWARSRQE
jgi:glutathione S-transferase